MLNYHTPSGPKSLKFSGLLSFEEEFALPELQAHTPNPDRTMTKKQVLDLYFMEARSKLIDLAAYVDRVERAVGEADFRHAALLGALAELSKPGAQRAKGVLMALSDPTVEPIPVAPGKGACGAWPGKAGANSN